MSAKSRHGEPIHVGETWITQYGLDEPGWGWTVTAIHPDGTVDLVAADGRGGVSYHNDAAQLDRRIEPASKSKRARGHK